MGAQVGLGPCGLSSGQMVKLMFALRVSHRVTGVRTHPWTHADMHTLTHSVLWFLFAVAVTSVSISSVNRNHFSAKGPSSQTYRPETTEKFSRVRTWFTRGTHST